MVAFECRRDLALPGAREIQLAIEQDRFQVVETPGSSTDFPARLGPGERAAITVVRAEGIGVLIDDRSARLCAQRLGLPILGTGGLLLIAKEQGLIESVGPLLAKIGKQGYRFSQRLVDELLRRAGETV